MLQRNTKSKGKVFALVFYMLFSHSFVFSAVAATFYNVDNLVSVIGGGSTNTGTYNNHPIREHILTVKNHNSTTTFENVGLLMQWAWTDGFETVPTYLKIFDDGRVIKSEGESA